MKMINATATRTATQAATQTRPVRVVCTRGRGSVDRAGASTGVWTGPPAAWGGRRLMLLSGLGVAGSVGTDGRECHPFRMTLTVRPRPRNESLRCTEICGILY